MGAVSVWRPFKELERLARTWEARFPRITLEPMEGEFTPPIETYTENGLFVVRADVPGLAPEDLDLRVFQNVLIITGERKREKEVKEENYLRREVCYGTFERRVDLPDTANTEKVKAQFKNGVVEIALPLAKKLGAKKIPLEIEH